MIAVVSAEVEQIEAMQKPNPDEDQFAAIRRMLLNAQWYGQSADERLARIEMKQRSWSEASTMQGEAGAMAETPITIAKWTIEEYHRMIEAGILDDKKVELLNGEIVEMPPEGVPHAGVGDRVEDHIRKQLGDTVPGALRDRAKLRIGKPITLPNDSEPEPDLCICRDIRYDTHHPYPEDIYWLVELADSSLRKDLEVKTQIYAAAGIHEYWVLNLKVMELLVFRLPTSTGYQSEQKFTQGTIKPLAFQDVSIDVQRLLS